MIWQVIYSVFVVVYAAFIFEQLITAIQYGQRLRSAVYVWCASPLPLLVVALVIERRAWSDLNINDLPWSLVFGDTFLVAPAASIAADVWRKNPLPVRASVGRRICSLVAGLCAGAAFHVWDVAANYTAADMPMALSPAKLLHDFGTFMAIIAALLCAVMPVLRRRSSWQSWHGWAILACFGGLVALWAIDGTRQLSAQVMHVAWYPSSSWNELFAAYATFF